MGQTMSETFKQQAAIFRDQIVQEALRILNVPSDASLGRILSEAMKAPARRLGEIAALFDERIMQVGLQEASRSILPRFVRDVEVHGADRIPAHGPLLIASNHPGMMDGLLIAANLPRPDIKIVASGMWFFSQMRALREHLILTTRNTQERFTVVRSAIRHLHEGGALLIFPRGIIEPDPDVLNGASASLAQWSPSLEVMIRRVPQTAVLVTVVRGVLSSWSLRNPITWLRREIQERQKTAEVIQAIQHLFLPRTLSLVPKLHFASPFTLAELSERFQETNPMEAIRRTAASLINHSSSPE